MSEQRQTYQQNYKLHGTIILIQTQGLTPEFTRRIKQRYIRCITPTPYKDPDSCSQPENVKSMPTSYVRKNLILALGKV